MNVSFRRFLEQQRVDGLALAASSDLLDLTPLEPGPSQRYLVALRGVGLVRDAGGVHRADRFTLGIRFPDNYLEVAPNPLQLVTVISPLNIWHPNALGPTLCPGSVVRGTTLVSLLFQVFEIITYHRVNYDERSALNRDACAWARDHAHEFPIDHRPLRRRRRPSSDEVVTVEAIP